MCILINCIHTFFFQLGRAGCIKRDMANLSFELAALLMSCFAGSLLGLAMKERIRQPQFVQSAKLTPSLSVEVEDN